MGPSHAIIIHRVKDLSPDQRLAVESLLGGPVREAEQISVSKVSVSTQPEWLHRIQMAASKQGVDRLTLEEIDGEIALARQERRERDKQSG